MIPRHHAACFLTVIIHFSSVNFLGVLRVCFCLQCLKSGEADTCQKIVSRFSGTREASKQGRERALQLSMSRHVLSRDRYFEAAERRCWTDGLYIIMKRE
ncbi:hypothetical protein B0T20DRAFT_218318 [Sordaria brevicollis]|uniref:Secreted protein n=1 Tax=Sordaria brevicollis TaxID=83679 RepID=A0AAE0PF41_SORBR|nr:hypothetical protein B0T20DRAFT_218318 [Sordaria brevicollis]